MGLVLIATTLFLTCSFYDFLFTLILRERLDVIISVSNEENAYEMSSQLLFWAAYAVLKFDRDQGHDDGAIRLGCKCGGGMRLAT
ncbi:hypothetical protein H4582DRAFT_2030425 [Lactarius indigo]|nr:hypothetical protein H4582DRAFT_2030425 [Lactarius indigo]